MNNKGKMHDAASSHITQNFQIKGTIASSNLLWLILPF